MYIRTRGRIRAEPGGSAEAIGSSARAACRLYVYDLVTSPITIPVGRLPIRRAIMM
jgi:hypothetical protein